MMGLLGQDHVCDDQTVWVTKTHYPFNKDCKAFKAQKMFCIVRNPLDAFPSYASLRTLISHSLEINENLSVRYPRWWDGFVKTCAERMNINHKYVMKTISQEIPTLILRYEDLVLNPEKELTDLLCFLLDVPSIEGTVAQRRIKTVVEAGHSKS